MRKIKWVTMPIPEKGATFAFSADFKDPFEVRDMIEANDLGFDVYFEYNNIEVWLIGHKNSSDHIATYVPDTGKLFTSTREAFRK